jgi:hypothetical protein
MRSASVQGQLKAWRIVTLAFSAVVKVFIVV